MSTKKLSNMSDDELTAEADRLAKVRTENREAQLEVSQEQEIRAALVAMSPETRRIIQLSLNGKIAPEGEPTTEGVPA